MHFVPGLNETKPKLPTMINLEKNINIGKKHYNIF